MSTEEVKAVTELVKETSNATTEAAQAATATVSSISDGLDKYFDAAAEIISKYGGDVAELGLNVLRIDAVSVLIGPIVFLSVLLYGVPTVLQFCKNIYKWQTDEPHNPYSLLYVIPCGYVVVLAHVAGQALNVWAWVGLFYPEVYAVHKFLL